MTIVVDANVLVVLISGDPRREAAQSRLREWISAGEDIHAPALLSHEVANGLTRLVAGGLFPSEQVHEAWQAVLRLPIVYHTLEAGVEPIEDPAKVRTLARQLIERLSKG